MCILKDRGKLWPFLLLLCRKISGPNYTDIGNIWMGLHYPQSPRRCLNNSEECAQENRDGWLWTDNTPVVGYSNWEKTEPNGESQCGCIVAGAQGKWRDLPCDILQSFICETERKEFSSVPPPPPRDGWCILNTYVKLTGLFSWCWCV